MLKVFLLEDEAKAMELLQHYVEQIPQLELVGTARDPLKALPFMEQHAVDLLFLDINLPHLSGLEFYKKLSPSPALIFTTAYPEYAVEGFDLEAVDYLLKPIPFSRFQKACERVIRQQQTKQLSGQTSTNFSDIVYIKSGPVTHKLSWKNILYLEKDENYVIYHTRDKRRILSRQTLADLQEIFPSYFYRIHKSYAVSTLYLERVEREQVTINGLQLPIGRTYRAHFLESL